LGRVRQAQRLSNGPNDCGSSFEARVLELLMPARPRRLRSELGDHTFWDSYNNWSLSVKNAATCCCRSSRRLTTRRPLA